MPPSPAGSRRRSRPLTSRRFPGSKSWRRSPTRLRSGDLAEALVITRGGLTKLVDRLIKAGLLERTFCETDRRVSYATLLPAGREMLEEMRPVAVAELRASFSTKLSVEEADAMRKSLERVRAAACSLG
jgi:DNA-binding MarR family transcriptional regulator